MKSKKRLTICLSLTTALSSIVPTTSLVSCSGKRAISQIVKDVIQEFKNIAAIPRPSDDGEHKDGKAEQLIRIGNYVKDQAKIIGVTESNIHETKEWHNVWFDVPASDKELENKEPLILQVHMDMVVAGMTSWEEKISTPIDVVVDFNKGIIHSKDYKTSIGADDGMGLAMILTFLKHKEFKHGPIRVICTTEEDAGMYGAEYIHRMSKVETSPDHDILFNFNFSNEKKTPIHYVLNVDSEEDYGVYRSSAGSATYEFSLNQNETNEDKLTSLYKLNIHGLKGGHSGVDMPDGRANADRLVMEYMHSLSEAGINFQLCQLWHPRKDEKGEPIDISYQSNQIVENSEVWFLCNANQEDQLNNILEAQVEFWKSDESWQYTADKDNFNIGTNIKLEIAPTNDDIHFFTIANSKKIATLLGKPFDPENPDSVRYGLQYEDDLDQQSPKVSANIAPTTIFYDDDTGMNFNVINKTRAADNDHLQDDILNLYDQNDDKKSVLDSWLKDSTNDAECEKTNWYPAWVPVEGQTNKMLELAKEGYRTLGHEAKEIDIAGGAEVSYWVDANKDLFATSVGSKITDCHTQRETCYIDSIGHCVDVIKYIALHLPNTQ